MAENMKQENQVLIYLSGFFVLILGLYYLVSQVDLIPDGIGPLGYLDDTVILLLLVFFVSRFVNRVSTRFNQNRKAYVQLWKGGNLVKIFSRPRTWLTILILTAVFSYSYWALDIVPDAVVGIGYIDDAILAMGALVQILKMYTR